MKLFKKIFLFSLVFVLAFVLIGCDRNGEGEDNKELADQLEALQGRLDELEALLNSSGSQAELEALRTELQGEIALLKSLLNSSEADNAELAEKIEKLEAELDELSSMSPDSYFEKFLVKNQLFKTLSFEWTDFDKGFDPDDAKEHPAWEIPYWEFEVGESVPVHTKMEVEAEYELGGAVLNFEKEFKNNEYLGFDYYWFNTGARNKGLELDKKDGTLSFKLPGWYAFGIYSLEFLPDGPDGEDIALALEKYYEFLEQTLYLEYSKLGLPAGSEKQLVAHGADSSGTLEWASSKPEFATVDANGKVTAVAAGATDITVKLAGTELVAKVAVTVLAADAKPTEARNYPAGYEGNYQFVYVLVTPGPQILTSDEEAELELKVGATDQLQVNDSDKYTVVSYASADESVFTVSAAGLVTAVAVGKSYVVAVVKDDKDVEKEVTLPVTVYQNPVGELAGGEEGAFINLKDSPLEQKASILAHMERYLINRGASIPVYNNSGISIYSERVNFLADEYVAEMGYGPTKVPMTTGTATGVGNDLAYRMWTSANPATLNHLAYADSIESDFLSLLEGGMFSFEWERDENGKGVGWDVKPEMAARLAYPVELVEDEYVELESWNGITAVTQWKFDLRQDLKWQNGDPLNANDFMFTYKEAINGANAYRRANLFTGGSLPIKGAKAYYDATISGTGDWSSVGIKQVDDYSFVIEFANNVNQWDVIYNLGSFVFAPVHAATYNINKTTYGTSMDRFMASGPYKLSYWEKDKEYRFTKNENYFAWNAAEETLEVDRPLFENFSFTIVKDSNAALQLFKEGLLDVTSVPASSYDEFKTWPNQKFVPGRTSFRLSVNRLTQAELDAKFGKGAWEAKPILQEDDFMWALYFGMDREGIQAITKTSQPWASYFTNAYSLVSSTEEGTSIETYRITEWGKKVYTGIYEGDFDLAEESLGYNQELAKLFFVSALDSMFAKEAMVLGTEANPTKIRVEIAHFDGVTGEATYAYVVQKYNELFNNTEKYGKKVIVDMYSAPQPDMDVYYAKQMTGQYDLAQAGISGGALDPVGFLETFCDDNRSGLLLSLGFDTHNPNILIDLDLDGDGVLDGAKWWSFDALYSAFNGSTFIKEGREATPPKED